MHFPKYCILIFAIVCICFISTNAEPYHKIIKTRCGELDMAAATYLCPAWVIALFGGVSKGSCASLHYTEFVEETSVLMGPCGRARVLVFRRGDDKDVEACSPRAKFSPRKSMPFPSPRVWVQDMRDSNLPI